MLMAKACLACRKAKRKCDNGRPCGRCKQKGLECVGVKARKRGPKRKRPRGGRASKAQTNSHDEAESRPLQQLPRRYPNDGSGAGDDDDGGGLGSPSGGALDALNADRRTNHSATAATAVTAAVATTAAPQQTSGGQRQMARAMFRGAVSQGSHSGSEGQSDEPDEAEESGAEEPMNCRASPLHTAPAPAAAGEWRPVRRAPAVTTDAGAAEVQRQRERQVLAKAPINALNHHLWFRKLSFRYAMQSNCVIGVRSTISF